MVTVLIQANKKTHAEVCHLTENHAYDQKKTLRQHELMGGDHHLETRFLQEQADEAEDLTTNIEDRPETVFWRCK